mmetsp:Transcript_1379/g.3032  ORF Transcript_1379/g.3032 Transcript_1379/m.3032 type:complete len:694 (-) Transcript_1379:93-2174(-)
MNFLPGAVKFLGLSLLSPSSFHIIDIVNALPQKSITGTPSPNNYILYEQSTDQFSSSSPSSSPSLKIQSNVPLTIHRYTTPDDSLNGYEPLYEGDGIILVTSNCDTSGTTIVPNVDIVQGRGAATGTTVVNVELMGLGDETTSRDMPFLKSSTYDATWYESGCLSYSTTAPPVPGPSTPSEMERTACLTEEECDAIRQSRDIGSFIAGEFPSKGCFAKNGIVYWGRGGSMEDISESDLPGVQERIWCEKEVLNDGNNNGNGDGDAGETTTACTTSSECDEKRLEMGLTKFVPGDYPSKGCFSKNEIAYWSDGSVEDISVADLPGVQERIWCDAGTETVAPLCEVGPSADLSMACGGTGLFCYLAMGVCNNKSGVHAGKCVASGGFCTEEYNPVCACDGITTYSNACKAGSAGVSVSRMGECGKDDGDDDTKPTTTMVDTVCLTEEECDAKRQEMNIASFYPGEFPTKGCFLKNERAYFSRGGSEEEISRADLPGVQKRIWCTKEEESSLSLRQADDTTDTSTQIQSEESFLSSSSVSLRPSLLLGSFFHSVLLAKSDRISSPIRSSSRVLDTCVYNVEVLLFGCNESFESTRIEVSAPTARVIDSETTNRSSETYSVNEIERLEDGTVVYTQDTKHTATLVFPEEQSDSIDVSGGGGDLDGYVEVPPLRDEGKCAKSSDPVDFETVEHHSHRY